MADIKDDFMNWLKGRDPSIELWREWKMTNGYPFVLSDEFYHNLIIEKPLGYRNPNLVGRNDYPDQST